MGATFQTALPQGMFHYVVGSSLPGLIAVAFLAALVAMIALAVHGSQSLLRSRRHRKSA